MSLSPALEDREQGKFRDAGGPTLSRVAVVLEGSLSAPDTTDTITAEYPSGAVEVYKYRVGGLLGTVLMTVTVTYTDSTKAVLSSVVKT